MVVGIDTYHDSAQRGRSVGGFIASTNTTMTRYDVHMCMETCLQRILNLPFLPVFLLSPSPFSSPPSFLSHSLLPPSFLPFLIFLSLLPPSFLSLPHFSSPSSFPLPLLSSPSLSFPLLSSPSLVPSSLSPILYRHRYYCQVMFQTTGQELADNLKVCMSAALRKYHDINAQLPDRIIIYRDGVGDGQLPAVVDHELPQILASFAMQGGGYKYV